MHTALQIVMAPLVGGVIGYITNALAIRMLFRPYTAKHIGKWRIPFTPGIIPKEKGRIAASIGAAIAENLMNREILEKNLLAPEMLQKIHGSTMRFLMRQAGNTKTLRATLEEVLSPKETEAIISEAKKEISRQVSSKLSSSDLGDKIAEVAAKHIADKIRVDGLDVSIPNMVKSFFGGPIWNGIAKVAEKPIRAFLAKNINQLLDKNGEEITSSIIGNEIEKFADSRMCDLLKGKESHFEQAADAVVKGYTQIISEQLPRILSAVNIPKIIESRINEMDMRQTEQMIFAVMKKELRALIWLGALLGSLIGVANAFI